MKRKITTFVLLLFVSLSLSAQNSTTLQKLINKNWIYIHETSGYEKYVYKTNFTATRYIISITQQGVPLSDYSDNNDDSDFYLSDQIETTFDYNKVGNVQNGKYIISYIPDLYGYSIFDVEEIIEITDTYLKIKNLESGQIFRFNAQ